MRNLKIRRAATLAVAMLLAGASLAFADTVAADGDLVTAGNQMTVHLGEHAPGEVVEASVAFTLTCAGSAHPDEGTTITLQVGTRSVPLGGDVAAKAATIGPIPASWPDDSQNCSSPPQQLASNEPSVVVLTMPTTTGTNFAYTLFYTKTGADGLSGATLVTFQVDVVANTPPTLVLPASFSVEGNTAGGAVVTYDASASDAEDDPDPTPDCAPASGSTFPLGTTTVNCSVTDSEGAGGGGSFDVTVTDTTGPTLAAHGDVSVTTTDPSGATVNYTPPAASDAVDSDPSVVCMPASGSSFVAGPTPVTCTATDDSGNESTSTFNVNVDYVPAVAWSVVWWEPVGASPPSLAANQGRMVPLKLQILANRVEQRSGDGAIRVAACGSSEAMTMALTWSSGRWNGRLDTSSLRPGCYTVIASLDGHDAGSFALDVRGTETATKPATSPAATKPAKPETAKGPKK
jgi:hypothetical protein